MLIATGSKDHTIRLWEDATGQLVRILSGADLQISAIVWAPDGARLVGMDITGQPIIYVWNPSSGTLLGNSHSGD